MRTITLLIAILFSISASAQSKRKLNKEMDSWVGSTGKEVIANYGAPDKVTTDGGTGFVMVFSDLISQAIPTLQANPYTRSLEAGPVQYSQYYVHRMFYMDNKGKIYNWRWEKNANPPQLVNANVNLNVRAY